MNKPIFRLELLQYVLGLDCRFSLEVLRAAMSLALECAEGWAPHAALPGAELADGAHAHAHADGAGGRGLHAGEVVASLAPAGQGRLPALSS